MRIILVLLLAMVLYHSVAVDPTSMPSGQPTGEPSGQPTGEPSGQPTGEPSGQPTGEPSGQPTGEPSGQPTSNPTSPTGQPSGEPTGEPSGQPSSAPTTSPPTSLPSGQPTSKPSTYGVNTLTALDGLTNFNQTYYCKSAKFMQNSEDAFQTIYFDVTMGHYVIQYMNVTVEPYNERDDFLRLRLADHEKFMFMHSFSNGTLQIVQLAPMIDVLKNRYMWFPLAERIQYKLLPHKDPSRCMQLFKANTVKRLKLEMTDPDGLISNPVSSYVRIMTAGITYSDHGGAATVISDADNTVAYEVTDPDNYGGSSDISITYGNVRHKK